jgi:hypothetical protein
MRNEERILDPAQEITASLPPLTSVAGSDRQVNSDICRVVWWYGMGVRSDGSGVTEWTSVGDSTTDPTLDPPPWCPCRDVVLEHGDVSPSVDGDDTSSLPNVAIPPGEDWADEENAVVGVEEPPPTLRRFFDFLFPLCA